MKLWPFSRKAPDEDALVEKITSQVVTKAAQTFDLSTLFFGGYPLGGGHGTDSAYSNSWVAYSCIKRLAQDAAGVPLLFLTDPMDPESTVPDSHPTKQLFDRPAPQFSRSEFVYMLLLMLNTRGEFFVVFDNPMRPQTMYPHLDPAHWKEVNDDWDLLGWNYQHKTHTLHRLPEEIVHHRLLKLGNPYRGQSPLQAAARAYQIETGAEALVQDIVSRGGEKAALYTSEQDITKQQREQATAALRARRAGDNKVGRDVILPNGIKPLDPKFVEEDSRVLEAAQMQPDKICSVYGVPKSLLGFEDIDKYATFEGRKRMYYTDTLVPMLTGVEESFDQFFAKTVSKSYQCHIRFDWSAVRAMQDDLVQRFQMAGEAHAKGIPWAVLNERFELGLDEASIPGADTVLVSATQVPIDMVLDPGPVSDPTPQPSGGDEREAGDKFDSPRLTNSLILKRARDPRSVVSRGVRLLKLEKDFRKAWRKELQSVMGRAVKAVSKIKTPSDVREALAPAFDGLGERLADVATPYHEAAALEGERAIIELTHGKMHGDEFMVWKRNHAWAPGVEDLLRARRNRVVGMADTIFDDLRDNIEASITDGAEAHELQHLVRERFGSAPGGINRAVTIARTEIGTAYNTARYAEMKHQGFGRHRWITALDEVVRGNDPDDEFDHTACNEEIRQVGEPFPCGLEFPQMDGGDAANVINCRCETIPVVEGFTDEP